MLLGSLTLSIFFFISSLNLLKILNKPFCGNEGLDSRPTQKRISENSLWFNKISTGVLGLRQTPRITAWYLSLFNLTIVSIGVFLFIATACLTSESSSSDSSIKIFTGMSLCIISWVMFECVYSLDNTLCL